MKIVILIFSTLIFINNLIAANTVKYKTDHFVIIYDTTSGSPDLVYEKDEDNHEIIHLPDGSIQELVAGNGHPDYVERIGIYLEYSRQKALDIGYNYPDDVLEVTIKDLQENNSKLTYGITRYDPDFFGDKYMYLDNNMDNWESLFENIGGSTLDYVLRGVVSHSIFIVVAGNDYLGGFNEFEDEDNWLVNGMANWYSNYIFDISNFFLTTMLRNYSSLSLNTLDSDYSYSGVGFLQFIEWNHSRAVLKVLWEKYIELRSSISALKKTYEELGIDFKFDFAEYGLQESFLKKYMDVPVDTENEWEKVDYWKTTLTPYIEYDMEVDVQTYYLDEEPNIIITPPKLSRGEFPIRIKSDPQKIGSLDITFEFPQNFNQYAGFLFIEKMDEKTKPDSFYIDGGKSKLWSIRISDFGILNRSVFINFVNSDFNVNYPYGIKISIKFAEDKSYPESPKNLKTEFDGKYVTIKWDQVPEPDINYYVVYRTPLSQKTPNLEDSIGVATDTFYVDSTIVKGEDYAYYVRSHNINGYKSPYSEKCSVQFCNLSFNLPKDNPIRGDVFIIPILINSVENLFSTSFDISYNPNVIDLLDLYEDLFLNENGLVPTAFLKNVDNYSGKIIIGLSRLDDNKNGVETEQNKTLLNLKFKAQTSDTCFLKFSNISFKSPDLSDIYVISKDTFVVINDIVRDTNQVADIYFKLPDSEVLLLDDFYIPVMISPVTDLYSVSLDIFYDQEMLEFEGIYESNFLNKNGLEKTSFNFNINKDSGKLIVGLSRLGDKAVTSNNEQELFRIKFKAIKIGQSQLRLSNVKLLYPDLISFKANPINNTIEVQNNMTPCKLFGVANKEEYPIGDTCKVKIKIGNVVNLFSLAFDLIYDSNSLSLIKVYEGNVFNGEGTVKTSLNFSNNNETGRLVIGLTRLNNSIPGISMLSDTTCMYIYFLTHEPGQFPFMFENISFLGPDGYTKYKVIANNFKINVLPPQAPEPFSKLFPKDTSYVKIIRPTLQWELPKDNDINDTLLFDLHYSTSSDFENETVIDSIKNNEYIFETDLIENQIYYWLVKAYDKYGLETWSNDSSYWQFCINSKNEAPSQFSLLEPENNSVIDTILPKLVWQKSNDPDPYDSLKYEIYLSKTEDFIDSIKIKNIIDTSLILEQNLEDNTKYFWKVKAYDNFGAYKWCNNSSFSFFVNLENDPPKWISLKDTTFYNNDSLIYNLNNIIYDPDDSLKNLNIFISFNNKNVYSYQSDTLLIIKAPGVNDKVQSIFTVIDPGNLSDVDTIYINIMPSTDIGDGTNGIPKNFILYQNYPNPFNPKTIIKYDLPKMNTVTLNIYNLLGRKIITLVNRKQIPGRYSITWDGKDELGKNVATGIYLYQLKTKDFVQTKKMILIR